MKTIRNDVIRLDKNDSTYFTDEGYLVDHPIVTSVGIFEYHNSDGSPRYELRIPEEVFDPASLKSYEGKPIIVTHDAGYVTKDNVEDEQIGTILTSGYKDGNDVRAKIIIHDTDAMKDSGLRELSLGYSLDLDETSGVWEGHRYDAIQRNIRINHLALVSNARAGEQARLNIDSKDKVDITIGGKSMKRVTRRDEGVLSPEEMQKAIDAFQNRKAERASAKVDEEKPEMDTPPVDTTEQIKDEELAVEEAVPEAPVVEEKKDAEEMPVETTSAEEKVQMVKDRRDRRDAEEEPEDKKALATIAQMDEDIDTLLEVIDELQAQKDMSKDTCAKDACCKDAEEEMVEEEKIPMNQDSVDRIFAQKWDICEVGRKLNMDGLQSMTISRAMKAVVKKVKPSINLDGKSKTYIKACYDMVAQEVKARKSTDFQRASMMGGTRADSKSKDVASNARQRMIERREGGAE